MVSVCLFRGICANAPIPVAPQAPTNGLGILRKTAIQRKDLVKHQQSEAFKAVENFRAELESLGDEYDLVDPFSTMASREMKISSDADI